MATPDRRSILIDAYENAAVIVSGVSPDQLRDATPCPGYDVAWAERLYNVRRWTEMPRGGHFAAAEEPRLLAADIAAFFAGL